MRRAAIRSAASGRPSARPRTAVPSGPSGARARCCWIAALKEITCCTMPRVLLRDRLARPRSDSRDPRSSSSRAGREASTCPSRDRVGRDEPRGERGLRDLQVRAGERELPAVLLLVALDLAAAARSRGCTARRAAPMFWSICWICAEHLLRLSLLRCNGAGCRIRGRCRAQHRYANEKRQRLSFQPNAAPAGRSCATGAPEGAGTSQVGHPSNDFGRLQPLFRA